MSRGDSLLRGVTKIVKGPDGRMGGACGSAAFMGDWLTWLKHEGERPTPEQDENRSDCGLVIWPDGRIEMFEAGGSFEMTPPYFAIGSGRPEALGAMYAGATAEQAVRAAIEHDAFTGGDVTVLRR